MRRKEEEDEMDEEQDQLETHKTDSRSKSQFGVIQSQID